MGRRDTLRTSHFFWQTKLALTTYFKDKYGVSEEALERRIREATGEFRLRKGQSINTQELWQKVGIGLAKEFNDHDILDKLSVTPPPTPPPDPSQGGDENNEEAHFEVNIP